MKTSTGRKKITKQDAPFIKDSAVIEPPKNLLTEHTVDDVESEEKKTTSTEEAKTEAKVSVKEESKEEVKADAEEVVKPVENEKIEVKPAIETVVQEVKPTESETSTAEPAPETEKKDDLPFIDNKPIDIKNDEVISSAASIAAPPPIPPISIPVNRAGMNPPDRNTNGKKIFGLILLVLIILVVGGTWFYFSNKSKIQSGQDRIVIFKPTGVIESPVPTKVASEEVKLDEYQVEVLNGSGKAGEASKVQGLLEDGRIKVSDTGNADNFEYTDTIIQAKKEVEKTFLDRLKSLLDKSYSIGKDETLNASESSDVIVIVGSEKAN